MSNSDDEEDFYSPQIHNMERRTDSSISSHQYPRSHSSLSTNNPMILQYNYSTHFVPTVNQNIELPIETSQSGILTTDASGTSIHIAVEDVQPYPTNPCSRVFLPYWILIFAFFLLFTAYSLVQNLASALFGDNGSASIAVVYVFFVISSIFAPVALGFIFKDNTTLMMFCGSISYTFFTISCIWGNIYALMLVCATLVGLSAGPLWISYATTIASFARNFAEQDLLRFTRHDLEEKQAKYHEERRERETKLWEQAQAGGKKPPTKTTPTIPNDSSTGQMSGTLAPKSTQLPFSTYNFNDSTLNDNLARQVQLSVDDQINYLLLPNSRVNPNKLSTEQAARLNVSTNEIIGLLNSIGWACLNLDIVVGALVSYFILNTSNTSTTPDSTTPDGSSPFIQPPSFVSNVIVSLAQSIHSLATSATSSTSDLTTSTLASTVQESPSIISTLANSTISTISSLNSTLSDAFSTLSGGGTVTAGSEVDSRPLFIVLGIAACIANVLYFLAFMYSPSSMFEVPQLDPKEQALHQAKLDEKSSSNKSKTVTPDQTACTDARSSLTPQSTTPVQSISDIDANPLNQSQRSATPSTPQFHNYPDPEVTITGNPDKLGSKKTSYDEYMFSSMNKSAAKNYDTEFELSPRSPTSAQPLGSDEIAQPNNKEDNKPSPPIVDASNPFFLVARSVTLMYHIAQQRIVAQSVWTWFAAPIPLSFMQSIFTAKYVKPMLGTANIVLIMMMVSATDAVSALGISRVMKQLRHARYFAFFGSIIHFTMVIMLLLFAFPPDVGEIVDEDMTKKAWIISSILAVVCGLADAMVQSGTNTATGMIADGSVEVRGASFGLSSVVKSAGSIFVFLSTKLITFRVQLWVIAAIVLISIGAQTTNILTHKPIDVDYLQDKYDNFDLSCFSKRKKSTKSTPGTELEDL